MPGYLRTSKNSYRVSLCLALCLLALPLSACGETAPSNSTGLIPAQTSASFPVSINPKIADRTRPGLYLLIQGNYVNQGFR